MIVEIALAAYQRVDMLERRDCRILGGDGSPGHDQSLAGGVRNQVKMEEASCGHDRT